jgi:D-tyrosyl-tRNA(Tyr) deacylase
MRALVQRVTSAEVRVAGEVAGRIGRGLCVLVGVTHTDDAAVAARMAEKLWGLRIFEDEAGLTNRSLADVGGEVLLVSQFTLYADTAKGRRPSFVAAARPEQAEPLVDAVVDDLRALGAPVATGRFRTAMQVELVNDGPFTLMLEVP